MSTQGRLQCQGQQVQDVGGAMAGEGLLYRPGRGSFPGDTIIIYIVHKICNFYFFVFDV